MVVNPRENASAIVLRSGKEVKIPVKAASASLKQEMSKMLLQTRMFLMMMRYLSISFRLFLIKNQYLHFLRL